MSLQIFDSLTRCKRDFEPLVPGKVGMYVCGVTVYDYSHVGHARVMVVFDIVYRWLRRLGYEVRYVRNFTDVDDKIIRRAAERGISIEQLTDEMIAAFHEDADALGCLRPTHEPRATAHMQDMIDMIRALMAQGYAYRGSSGDILFSVRRFERYGRLSGKNIDELEAGSRVAVDEGKRDPLDFVLWKMAKPGEPAWDSPWGRGRPGWHIECSAMSCAHLGETFDIHGGGMDLKFPHHENEIAQAVCANHGGFARYWMHNGFVNINAEKMSKSLGNFFTIREVLDRFRAEVLRMLMLETHYRSPLEFSDQAMHGARAALDRIYELKRRIAQAGLEWAPGGELPEAFARAMNDDFNTPEALAVIFEHVRMVNKALDRDQIPDGDLQALVSMTEVLGIARESVTAWFGMDDVDVAYIQRMIDERLQARKARDYERADAIREQLRKRGILLEDTPSGTIWKKA